MDRNIEIKERLELALRPADKPPTLEEVLKHVSTRGALRGPVDWVFPAWMLYVEYATQKIAETFPLSEEEKRQLSDFRDAMKRLLTEAWTQTKEKLTTLYKAVTEGTYRTERNKLYTPDGVWMYVNRTVIYFPIHGISASARFPDVLKLPHERLELFQLGWRASDEGEMEGRPYMSTTQPWQVFAWAAARYGAFRIRVASVNLTREGVSVTVHLRANSWRQRRDKAKAIELVVSHLRRGEWTPLLTTWLGDGRAGRREVLRSEYRLVVVTKEPWRLGLGIGEYEALVASGKEAFVKLKEAADAYGELLDLLNAHKWFLIKLATNDALRVAFKQKTRKRSIDVLREVYRHSNSEISTEQFSHAKEPRRGAVAVAGVVLYLYLNNRSGSFLAGRYTRVVGKALAIAERLESAGLRPNVVQKGPNYMVYIPMADLLKLAEKDETIRKAIAQFLAEKAKNGTPRQREIAEKLLKRYPLFPLSMRMRFGMPHGGPWEKRRRAGRGDGRRDALTDNPYRRHRSARLTSPSERPRR